MKFLMSKSAIAIFLLTVFVTVPLTVEANSFNPNQLITDDRFADTATLGGAEGIQRFLESKGSVLANTTSDFLLKLREPGDPSLKSRLPDPRPNLGRLRTAAELIYDAATSAGLNAQVILVTLQKEQSLVNGKFDTYSGLQRALDRALGFGCPDEGGCSDIFLGFYYQLFGNFDAQENRYIGMPASLMRSFYYEVGGVRVGRGPMVDANNNSYGNGNRIRISRTGDTITLENTQGPPNNAPQYQTVILSNFATTALYRYTPHIYNGNYNFWKFFNEWFRYPNGTLLQTGSDSKIYVTDNGFRRQISTFVMTQRGLNSANIISVSNLEIAEFPVGDVMPPVDGTILRDSSNKYYLIDQDVRKLLSSFVAVQRKVDLATAQILPDIEIQSYKDGGVALPAEGTLVKSQDSPAVYIITNNQKRLLSAFVFKQRGYKFADVLEAKPGELDTYPTGLVMPPFDGTLVKAKDSPAVYHVGNGLLEPLTYFVFVERDFRFRDVISVDAVELELWQKGKPMPPPTGTLVKALDGPTVYYMEAGVRRAVSYAVFLKNVWSFEDIVVTDKAQLEVFELGENLPLPDRTLAKLKDNPAVYYLVDAVWRPLTLKAFQNRRLLFEHVVEVSQEEFAKFPVGAVVEN